MTVGAPEVTRSNDGRTIHIVAVSNRQSIREVRDTLRDFLSSWVEKELITPFVVATEELLLNEHEHGHLKISSAEKEAALSEGTYERLLTERESSAPAKELSCIVVVTHSEIRVTVTGGVPFTANYSVPREHDLAEPRFSGRGLALVRAFFDRVEFDPVAKEVRAVKRLWC